MKVRRAKGRGLGSLMAGGYETLDNGAKRFGRSVRGSAKHATLDGVVVSAVVASLGGR